MKRLSFLGWLGAIFGSLGTLLCIVALVIVWILSFQLRDSVGHVFSRVSTILSQVRDGSEEITARIDSSREAVHELDQRIETAIENLADNVDAGPEELDELTGQARLIVRRLQDWQAFARSAREFSGLAEEIIRSTAIFFRTDNRTMESIRTSLEKGQQQIEEAIAAFDELTALLESARETRKREDYSERVKPLVTRIDGALGSVQEHTAAFTTGVVSLEEGSRDLGRKIRGWIFFGTVLISLLIVWQGAGQVCLARSGRARIKSRRRDAS